MKEFRVISVNGNILGAAPRPDNLVRTSKLLGNIRRTYQYDLVDDGLAIPEPLEWGKNNDPNQWWRINDYEILCAAFRHEVEMFVKTFAHYLPKEETEHTTPRKPLLARTVDSGILPHKTFKVEKKFAFLSAQPISDITSST